MQGIACSYLHNISFHYRARDKEVNYLFIHLNLSIALAMGLATFIGGIEHAVSSEVTYRIIMICHWIYKTAVSYTHLIFGQNDIYVANSMCGTPTTLRSGDKTFLSLH